LSDEEQGTQDAHENKGGDTAIRYYGQAPVAGNARLGVKKDEEVWGEKVSRWNKKVEELDSDSVPYRRKFWGS
jgi:hypothetical protein